MSIRNDRDRKIILLLFALMILILVTLVSHYSDVRRKNYNFNIRRLSEEYYNNENKEADIFSNDAVTQNSAEEASIDINNNNVIEEQIISIEELINTNKFDELLKMYNKEYVEDFNINIELLKDKFKFADKITANITKVKHDGVDKDRAIVNVRLMNENNGERMVDFTVFSDGTIADLPLYREIIPKDKITERDNVTYTFKKKYTTRLGSIYVLNIKNNSEVKVDIQDIKGILGTSLEYEHELINGNKFTYQITPEEDVTMAIKICNQDKPDDILISNKKMDGSIETFGIWSK